MDEEAHVIPDVRYFLGRNDSSGGAEKISTSYGELLFVFFPLLIVTFVILFYFVAACR